MGFYENQVLPRAIDVMLGRNVPYYPPEVSGVWTVDPSVVGMKLARKRIAASPVRVHEGGLDGARLDFPDDRFDAALSTMMLCTIPDAAGALGGYIKGPKAWSYMYIGRARNPA